jgi:hypothetical protein
MNMTVSVLASQFKPEWIPNAAGPVVRLSAEEAAKWWEACNELVMITSVSRQTGGVTLVIGRENTCDGAGFSRSECRRVG